MPIDKVKNQRKGFCFITFDNEQIVHELLKKPKQTINGKEVIIHIYNSTNSMRLCDLSFGTITNVKFDSLFRLTLRRHNHLRTQEE